jgi:hypothetical protein
VTVSDLEQLLKEMQPILGTDKYFIASVEESSLMALTEHLASIICIFRENEGLTIVFQEDIKEDIESMSGSGSAGPFALITLNVYSDLMAVGFLARITEALAEKRISVNAFSAFHHDHLLVPYEKRDAAMESLKGLSEKS